MIVASWYAVFVKADRIIASSGPISVGIPGLAGKYLGRKKLVFEVRDLWPEGAIEMGIISNRYLIKLFYWFEKLCYNSSSLIVALSPGMRENIATRFPDLNVISVTNSANLELFNLPIEDSELPDDLVGKKYAIYNGNIGPVNNSTLLKDAAKIIQEDAREDIVILMIGDGQQKEEMVQASSEIKNLLVFDLMPKKSLVPLLQQAMVSLVPLANKKVFATSSPNKLFESLAAGVPVIQTTNGWIKEFLETEKVGLTVSPDNPHELANLLISCSNNPEKLDEFKFQTKKVASKYFNKDVLAQQMLDEIIKA